MVILKIPKLIDDKGMVFGKINLFDLIVVMFGILVIIVGVNWVISEESPKQVAYVEFMIEGIKSGEAEAYSDYLNSDMGVDYFGCDDVITINKCHLLDCYFGANITFDSSMKIGQQYTLKTDKAEIETVLLNYEVNER